jgi:O-antigen/teichoic acid export membrane protein
VEEEIFTERTSRLDIIARFLRRQFHQGRGGRAKLAISTSVVARLANTAIGLITLPIIVRYLGNEGYGLMVTITSVVAWLQFSNMGLGIGLQNALTEETGKGDQNAQAQLVSTAVVALATVGIVLLAVGALVFPLVDWLKVFPPTSNRFVTEIPWTLMIVFFGFVSTVVLGFVGPIYAARQELHVASLPSVVSGVIGLLGIILVTRHRLGLVGIVTVTIGATAAVQWCFALWTLYGRRLPELRPSMSRVSKTAWWRICHTGFQFFLLQVCAIVFSQLDAILITQFLSADQVTPYALAQRIFLYLGGLFAIVTGSLWSAYGHAKAQGDATWIRSTHHKITRLFALFFGALAIIMIVGGKQFLGWWIGTAAAPTVSLIAAVAFYFSVREWISLNAMLLNGLNVIREQILPMLVAAAVSLGLELYFIRRYGTIGLALGGGAGLLLGGGWYLFYLTRHALAQINEGASSARRD